MAAQQHGTGAGAPEVFGERVVAAVDSRATAHVLRTATALAARVDLPVDSLHVTTPHQARRWAAERADGIALPLRVLAGDPETVLTSLAADGRDLLVIGAGGDPATRAPTGPLAERVLGAAAAVVAVVPHGVTERPGGIDRVLATGVGSAPPPMSAVVVARLRDVGCAVTWVGGGTPADALVRARELDVDLVLATWDGRWRGASSVYLRGLLEGAWTAVAVVPPG